MEKTYPDEILMYLRHFFQKFLELIIYLALHTVFFIHFIDGQNLDIQM